MGRTARKGEGRHRSAHEGRTPGHAQAHGSERSSARERILSTATRLFSQQGYQSTGINQIIAEADTAKATFYQHFDSKDQLGISYLDLYANEQFAFLRTLMERNPEPQQFARAWARLLKRQARATSLYGCAMANLNAQTRHETPEIQEHVRQTARRTVESIEAYLTEARRAGHLAGKINPRAAARQLFAMYEGVLQAWLLTGDEEALSDLPQMAAALLPGA